MEKLENLGDGEKEFVRLLQSRALERPLKNIIDVSGLVRSPVKRKVSSFIATVFRKKTFRRVYMSFLFFFIRMMSLLLQRKQEDENEVFR